MSRAAYSLAELIIGLSLFVILGATSAPALLAARDGVRADGAADLLVSRLHGARMEALKRRAYVAVRFEADRDDYRLALYVDGNGNGVRAVDIASGVDALIQPRDTLDAQFADVRFGFEDGVPDVDDTEPLDDRDPIRVGRSRMLSFSPTGTSSSGTVYLHGHGRRQLAVRVLGGTGRIRSLVFDFGTRQWRAR